jgi:hypothetical protein
MVNTYSDYMDVYLMDISYYNNSECLPSYSNDDMDEIGFHNLEGNDYPYEKDNVANEMVVGEGKVSV